MLKKNAEICWQRSFVQWCVNRGVPEEYAANAFRVSFFYVENILSFQSKSSVVRVGCGCSSHTHRCKWVFVSNTNPNVLIMDCNGVIVLIFKTGNRYDGTFYCLNGGFVRGKCFYDERNRCILSSTATFARNVLQFEGQYRWTGAVIGDIDECVAHGKGTAMIDGKSIETTAFYGLLGEADYSVTVEGVRKKMKL